MLSLSRALLVVCLLCPLLSVSAFFALNSPKLVIERLDPLVNPGGIAAHLHTVLGGSNWSDKYDYDDLQKSDCTTMPVSVDKSNYWTPTLYYVHPDQSKFEVVPLGFGRIYYLPRPGPTKKEKIVAFPKGFRMVAGDMNRRTFNESRQQDKAISFVCLDYYGNHQGDPEWFQRNDFFTKHNCPNGMRLQFNFPACWDGVNLYKDDNSHVAYTIQNVDNGDCPDSHPVHFVNLFFEFIYDTQNFPINPNGLTWALSNGDTTGYGFHGDFTNGWDVDVLQAAIDQCDDAGGDPAKCEPFKPYMQQNTEACHPAQRILSEKVGLNGEAITYLPGCNKLWTGDVPKPTCAADWPGLHTNLQYEPVQSVLPSGWQRLGCFAEGTTGKALTGAFVDLGASNTGAACAAYCTSLNFSIAVTEYATQCYCGSQLANGASLQQAAEPFQCHAVCPGRYTENCGGNGYMNVMFNPSIRATPASASVLPAGWFRDGCVTEPSFDHLLKDAVTTSNSLTPVKCVAFCANATLNGKGSFAYAGTEYARECYCANVLPAAASPRADNGKCNMACTGASGLNCGGAGFLSLYSLRPELKIAALNATALPTSWAPLGCFQLSAAATAQLTTAPFFTDAAMTNGMCAGRCAQFHASYAVTQYGSQCFCGDANSLAAETKTSMALAPTQCESTCSGAVLERCGGVTTSSVMLTGAPGTGAPAASASSSSTGAAGPSRPTEVASKLRLRANLAASLVSDYAWQSTMRLLVASALGVDSYRVAVGLDSGVSYGRAAVVPESGRRLLQASASVNQTEFVASFLPASSFPTDGSTYVLASTLRARFVAAFANPQSDLAKQLVAQGVDPTYSPQMIQEQPTGGETDINAAHAVAPAGAAIAAALAALVLALVL